VRSPWLTGLNVASMALGVAVFLAVQIANRGAIASFRSAAELTTGTAALEVRGDLPDRLLPAVRAITGVAAATPLVEGIVPVAGVPGEYLRILGVDPFSGSEIFAFRLESPAGGRLDFERWLADPSAIAVNPAWAERLAGWSRYGKGVEVTAPGGDVFLEPVFHLASDLPAARAEPRLVAMDIGWAQELLAKTGRLSAIQLTLDPGTSVDAVAGAVKAVVPGDASVAPPAARSREMEDMVAAFQLNLTAMSMVSVVVGMFLVYNSTGASVVRRQRQIAILRACGTSRSEVRALFLAEALAQALVGSVLGILAAPLLAAAAAPPVSSTISSLYEVVRVEPGGIGPAGVAMGLLVGLAASAVAAWLPASEAAGIEPAKILHEGAGGVVFRDRRVVSSLLAGVCLAAAWAGGWWALNGGPPVLGFFSAACVMGGFSFAVPWFVRGVAAGARLLPVLYARLAADHLSRSLHRNWVTVAALAAAISMSVAVSVMIHSFRESLARWVDRTLVSDAYIAPAANEVTGMAAFLPDGLRDWAAAHPAVAETGTFRELPVRVSGHLASLAVVEGRARGELEFLDRPDAAAEFARGESVAVSESLATRLGGVPEKIELPTPAGDVVFPVAGVYRDYTRERGTVLLPRTLFARHWDDARLHSVSVKMKGPAALAGFTEEIRRTFPGAALAVYDNASLRVRIFEIFDGTFAVTYALRVVAVIVAVAGVAFSLAILAAERAREVSVLRSVGASRGQVFSVYLCEAGLLGLAAGLCGLVSGSALALVLTWVVNKAFFGWSISLAYPLATLLATPFWVVPVALAAAVVPSWAAARRAPSHGVRFE